MGEVRIDDASWCDMEWRRRMMRRTSGKGSGTQEISGKEQLDRGLLI